MEGGDTGSIPCPQEGDWRENPHLNLQKPDSLLRERRATEPACPARSAPARIPGEDGDAAPAAAQRGTLKSDGARRWRRPGRQDAGTGSSGARLSHEPGPGRSLDLGPAGKTPQRTLRGAIRAVGRQSGDQGEDASQREKYCAARW